MNDLHSLVTKHDSSIVALASSLEHLAQAQATTNSKIDKMTDFLTKQAVVSDRLGSMERELTESFSRRDKENLERYKVLHKRLDEIKTTQVSDTGCNSVKLLHKDCESNTREIIRLVGNNEEHSIKIEDLEQKVASYLSPGAIRWSIGLAMLWSVSFGTYVVQSFSELDKINSKIAVMLDRDIRDTAEINTIVMKIFNKKTDK